MPNTRRFTGRWIAGLVLCGAVTAQGEVVFISKPGEAATAQVPSQPGQLEIRDAPVLYLNGGDYFRGRLGDAAKPNVLRWQADGAAQPFEFSPQAVHSAYFVPPQKRPAAEGDYCLELSDGDILFGSLKAITNDQIEVASSQFGNLKIARAEVHSLTPAASAAFVYRGPNGIGEWSSENIDQWQEEAGRLITKARGAMIKKEIPIPQQAHFEFEISWSQSPQFTLGFCLSNAPDELKEGFRFEVWGQKLVLVRELEHDADVATAADLDSRTDRVHLEALYNYSTGKFTVRSLDGRELAKVMLPNGGEKPLRFVWLQNGGGTLCLEQLAVGRWSGQVPSRVDVDKPRVHKIDGTIVYGDVLSFQAGAKQIAVKTGDTESRIESSDIACMVLAPEQKKVAATFRIMLHNGCRFSGDLLKVEAGKLYLQRHGVDQPLACPVGDLRSLVSLKREGASPSYTTDRIGRWETKGVRSRGSLVEGPPSADPQVSCLVWKPRGSATASALRADISGRIVYRDLPTPTRQDWEDARRQRINRRQVVVQNFSGQVQHAMPYRQATLPSGAGNLCLLTGDRVPCEAIQIDEEGIHFTSSVVASTSVPHRAVKALEFVPKWTAAALAEAKRMRLLTLPRMQKGNPPTHLIVSTSGDFLRCRLISMDANSLHVETRLENSKIARDQVACIIWLHDLDGAKPASAPTNKPPSGLLVQAVQSDGIRMTFVPHECDRAAISGTSDVLGACRIRLNVTDALILGGAIREAAQEQGFADWKLHDAIEPEYAREGAAGGNPDRAGLESILVGKPAPDFKLDLLGGGSFELSKRKGKVVVLSFWASWCGQCMQVMPEVAKLAGEFKGRDVEFVDVNMQEDEATVKAALERLKIQPTIAMDIDGAAAERFQVGGIPHMVVIDKASSIAALTIGANPGFADELKAAIQKCLAPKAAK
jgi:thiol-disulfide isomerase/thioredoxin